MAQNIHMIGGATAVATSVNATGSWGGSAGSDIWLRPIDGQASIGIGSDLLQDAEIGRTRRHASFGGNKCSGSVTRWLSYAYLENFFRSLLQGAITTTGSSAPYNHALAYSEFGEVYGGHKYYWTDYQGGEYQINVTDTILTKLSLAMPVDSGTPQCTEQWVGRAWAEEGSIVTPSISSNDLVRWPDISIFLGGAEYCMKNINFDLDSPVDDSDYAHCSAAGRNRVSLIRNGALTISVDAEKNMDSVDLSWIVNNRAGIGSYATNYILISNGLAGADEREIKINFGVAYLKTPDSQVASQGILPMKASFEIRDTDGAGYLGVNFKNALASIV